MHFDSLRVFCDLAETASFTKTAQINEVTQSAVSQTISALERQFKTLLIERSKKNFRLTREGEVLYEYGQRMLQAYDGIHSKFQEMKDIISGEVRVATIYSIGLHILPPYVTRFMQIHPAVNVQVRYRPPGRVYEDVLENVVDLGLVAYPRHEPNLEVVNWRKDPLAFICSPQHPLAKLKRVRIKALNGLKFVGFTPDIPTRIALDKIFKAHGVKVAHVMEFDNIETVKRAVEIDSGAAVVPELVVRQEVADGTLASAPIEGNPFRQLGIIYKKHKVLSPAVKRFMTLLEETL